MEKPKESFLFCSKIKLCGKRHLHKIAQHNFHWFTLLNISALWEKRMEQKWFTKYVLHSWKASYFQPTSLQP